MHTCVILTEHEQLIESIRYQSYNTEISLYSVKFPKYLIFILLWNYTRSLWRNKGTALECKYQCVNDVYLFWLRTIVKTKKHQINVLHITASTVYI